MRQSSNHCQCGYPFIDNEERERGMCQFCVLEASQTETMMTAEEAEDEMEKELGICINCG